MSLIWVGLVLLLSSDAVAASPEKSLQPVSAPSEKSSSTVATGGTQLSIPAPEASLVPSPATPSGMMMGVLPNLATLTNQGPLTLAQIDALFLGSFPDVVAKLRDPFKMPVVEAKIIEAKTELERYQLAEFRLVGVLTGPKRLRAMVVAPGGKTYFVSENMKIGTTGGRIHRITADAIQVREKVVNAIGEVENVDSEILLAVVTKQGAQQGGSQQGGSQQGMSGMH